MEMAEVFSDEVIQQAIAAGGYCLTLADVRATEKTVDLVCDDHDEALEALLELAAADRQEREDMERAEEERAEALERSIAISAVMDRICEAISAALPRAKRRWKCAGSGSRYLHYEVGIDICLKLRVSDHAQPVGGGYSEVTGERMGEADVSWLVESPDRPIPTRAEIRQRVLRAIRRLR